MKKRYPFYYLKAYNRDDKDFYFGREEEVEQLYDMSFETNLLLVYGVSGTGKTSLIQCGLANKFESHEWLSLSVRRGNNINDSLTREIEAQIGTVFENPDTTVTRQLEDLHLTYFKPIYLIFDQFEELYILGDKKEQDTFYHTIQQILAKNEYVKIILSIREEYLGHLCYFEKVVGNIFRKKLRIEPVKLDKLERVLKGITNPEISLVTLQEGQEKELAQKIFTKLQENEVSIELPYLQVLLEKLYEKLTGDETHQQETTLTLQALEEMSEIGDILFSLLDNLIHEFHKQEYSCPDVSWRILSAFVTSEGTKRPLSKEVLQSQLKEIDTKIICDFLKFFTDKKIIQEIKSEQLYEISHDALAKQIHRKRTNEEVRDLQIKEKLTAKLKLNEPLSENQLSEIDQASATLKLIPEEKDLIKYSRQIIRKKQLQKRVIIIAIVLIALLSLGVTIFFTTERRTHAYYADFTERWNVPQGIIPLKGHDLTRRNTRYHFIYLTKGFTNIRLEKVIYEDIKGIPRNHENAFYLGREGEAIREFTYKKGELEEVLIYDENGKLISKHSSHAGDMMPDGKQQQPEQTNTYLKWHYELEGVKEPKAGDLYFSLNQKGYVSKIEYKSTKFLFNDDFTGGINSEQDYGEKFLLDSLGRRIKTIYLNNIGQPAEKNGIAAIAYQYDSHGNINYIEYQNAAGKPAINVKGWAIEKDSADYYGNIIQKTFHYPDGKLFHQPLFRMYIKGVKVEEAGYDHSLSGKNEIYRTTWKYDKNKNIIEEAYWDKEYELIRKNGYEKIQYAYDQRGNKIEEIHFGFEKQYEYSSFSGKPVLTYIPRRTFKYDNQNHLIEKAFWANDTERVMDYYNHYAIIRWKYDKKGNCTEKAFFDLNEQPCIPEHENHTKIVWEYDKQGHKIQESYFGLDGKPCNYRDKAYAMVRWEFDASGNKTEQSYWDTHGNPATNKVIPHKAEKGYWKQLEQNLDKAFEKAPIFKTVWKYNEAGKEIEIATYDTENRLALEGELPYARKTTQYDADGNKTEEAYWGVDNQPCLYNGVAKIKWQYDSNGNPVERTYWDTNDAPCLSAIWAVDSLKGAYACVNWKYTDSRFISEVAFFDREGNPCIRLGRAKLTTAYDAFGNKIEETTWGVDGKPCLINNVATTRWKYNEKGQEIERATYDTQNRLIVQNRESYLKGTTMGGFKHIIGEGIARRTQEYNENGHLTTVRYYDANNRPCLFKNKTTEEEYIKITYTHDKFGNKRTESFWSTTNYPDHTITYNTRGDILEEAYFDKTGKLRMTSGSERNTRIHSDKKYARIAYKYEYKGVQQTIETTFYNQDNNPILVFKKVYPRLFIEKGPIMTQLGDTVDVYSKKTFIEYFMNIEYLYNEKGYLEEKIFTIEKEAEKRLKIKDLDYFEIKDYHIASECDYDELGRIRNDRFDINKNFPLSEENKYIKVVEKYNEAHECTETILTALNGKVYTSTERPYIPLPD